MGDLAIVLSHLPLQGVKGAAILKDRAVVSTERCSMSEPGCPLVHALDRHGGVVTMSTRRLDAVLSLP